MANSENPVQKGRHLACHGDTGWSPRRSLLCWPLWMTKKSEDANLRPSYMSLEILYLLCFPKSEEVRGHSCMYICKWMCEYTFEPSRMSTSSTVIKLCSRFHSRQAYTNIITPLNSSFAKTSRTLFPFQTNININYTHIVQLCDLS